MITLSPFLQNQTLSTMEEENSPFGMNKEELRKNLGDAETGVYWDVEDFPVRDIVSFNQNIRLALATAGYHGRVSITAYGEKEPEDEYYKNAGITFVPRGSKRGRLHTMLMDILLWAVQNRAHALTNVMVVAKNIMPDDDIFRIEMNDILLSLYTGWYNVLLAVPDDYQLERLPYGLKYTVWRWSDLCAGGYPLDDSLVYRPYPPPPPDMVDQKPPAYLNAD